MSLLHSPKIVTNGLVLCFDAASRKSYPGTGNVWRDLSGNGNDGTLTNSPIYSPANLGNFQFATNTYISTTYNTSLDTQTPTVEVWVKTNATTQNGFWFEKGFVNSQYSLFQQGTTVIWRTMGLAFSDLNIVTNTYINTSNWYQVVGTYSSGFKGLYINGVLANFDIQSGTIFTNNLGCRIGAYGGGAPSYYYNGSLAICKVYNRALSAQEILQNFNATRGRYGI